MANALLRLGHPVVDVLGTKRFHSVVSFDTDAKAVAQLAADFFLRSGFRNLGFCGYRGIPFSDRREAAFADHLSKHGVKVRVFAPKLFRYPSSHIQAVEQSGLAAERAIAGWLRKQPMPLGLFACNDVRAQQVLNACREHGIKVPEEVAVIGVDDDDVLCNICEPPLTSIQPDTERLGFEAAEVLDQIMRGKRPKLEIIQIPPLRVVERTSTDVVPVDDPITVQAIRFIRDHVDRGIGVKDVLTHVNRSRTDLEGRFRRWLTTSIRTEIIRRRIDRVCSLLQQTDLTLDEIAKSAGISTTAHLCRMFQHKLGQTPSDYRHWRQKRP